MLSARLLLVLAVLTVPFHCFAGGREATPRQTYRVELAPAGAAPVRLYAEEWGEGPPVLLIHGLGTSTYTWRHIAPRLAETHRVVALDLKGFGRSDKPFDSAYSARDQAELVARFVAKRQLDRVTLVGHSFGGTVALLAGLELERRAPGSLARLVLIDAPALPQTFAREAALVSAPVLPYALLAATPPELLVRWALTLARHPRRPPPERDIGAYAAPLYELGARHALIATAQGIVANDTRAWMKAYGRLSAPALLVWCRDDRIVPLESGRRLARVLPHAHLGVLSGCNHIPHEERPAAALALLRRFLHE